MLFTQRVISITYHKILPKVIDNVLVDNFMTYRYISNGEKWAGETLRRPIKYQKNNLGGSFAGLDQHSTASVETRITLTFDPRGYEIPVSIPGIEAAVNAVSETQVLNLVRTEMESSQMDALDDIGSMLYKDGSGNNSKDFFGLDVLDDDGTSQDLVGQQSRTTYPVLKGTRTASGGTVSLSKLATLFSDVAGGSAMRQRPTVIVSSQAEFDLYDSLLSPTVRNNYESMGFPMVTRRSKGPVMPQNLKATGGFTSLIYRGIPWVADQKAPTQTVWFLNENYLCWYGLKHPDYEAINLSTSNVEGVYDEYPTDNTGFQWSGFLRPVNQFGEIGHIYLLGNLITDQPRRHGRLTGVTTV